MGAGGWCSNNVVERPRIRNEVCQGRIELTRSMKRRTTGQTVHMILGLKNTFFDYILSRDPKLSRSTHKRIFFKARWRGRKGGRGEVGRWKRLTASPLRGLPCPCNCTASVQVREGVRKGKRRREGGMKGCIGDREVDGGQMAVRW
jgi:hypothetical protein